MLINVIIVNCDGPYCLILINCYNCIGSPVVYTIKLSTYSILLQFHKFDLYISHNVWYTKVLKAYIQLCGHPVGNEAS